MTDAGQSTWGLGVDLHRRLASAGGGNVVISPVSVGMSLAMTHAGARGATAREVARALRLDGDADAVERAYGAVSMRLSDVGPGDAATCLAASGLWAHADCNLRDGFARSIETRYGASLERIDFRQVEAARGRINRWVAEHTAGHIESLVADGALDVTTQLLLASAIYFKGRWAWPFDAGLTTDAPFWIANDRAVEVPMMHQVGEFGYFEDDGKQLLELPYNADWSMMVALPRARDGLAALEGSLDARHMGEWTRLPPRRVRVSLPRFALGSAVSLRDALRTSGVVDAFDPRRADFTGMAASETSLFLGEVLHGVRINVDEAGTEAAAATAAIVRVRLAAPAPPTFTADHPFVFWIRDAATGCVFFMGRILEPPEARR
jgi:serpin B